MISGILGILHSGAAYLPLDPQKPRPRNRFSLKDSAARWLLVAGNEAGNYDNVSGELNIVDMTTFDSQARHSNFVSVHRDSLAPAYVIYTSGSTGVPKGVMIRHRSVLNRLHWMQSQYPIGEGDRILQKTPYDFDVSVWELFWWSFQGASLYFLPPGQEKDPFSLWDAIVRFGVTVVHFVPSLLNVFLDALENNREIGEGHSLERVFASGEALAPIAARRFYVLFPGGNTRLANLYGPTEATVDVSYFNCPAGDRGDTVPIGKPIDNTRLLTLDRNLRIVPYGLAGELYIAGVGLAMGYLNRPELTASSFVPDPFSVSGIMYKTGDLARFLPDGNIEFLGRADFQVKVRGNRIELGEIEAIIKEFPAIRDTVAVARADQNQDISLVAYIVPDEREAPVVRRLLEIGGAAESAGNKRCRWDNGMSVFYLNRTETEFMYDEIFTNNIYMRHGITLPEDAVVLDCGANIGVFSLFIDNLCPTAKIYAFEPAPPVYDLLKLNTFVYNPTIQTYNFGISSVEGEFPISFYPHATILSGAYADREQEIEAVKSYLTESLTPEQIQDLLEERLQSRQFLCPMKTISGIIRELGLQIVDLLKIDIEKAEVEALRRIEDCDWQKIRQVTMEVHDSDNRLRWIVEMLECHGFAVSIDQDLGNSSLYNLYARRADYRPVPAAAKKDGAVNQWRSVESLVEDLLAGLKDRLPGYMIPSFVVPLLELPLTSSGKTDRKALPRPVPVAAEEYSPPENDTERRICSIWSAVLGIPEESIGVRQRFFSLGGHSLKAAGVVSGIERDFSLRVPLIEMFKDTTIRNLARYIDDQLSRTEGSLPDRSVLLKKGEGRNSKLFLFHDGSGTVECYAGMAAYLPQTIECFGIQADPLPGLAPVNTTIEELASDYLRSIRSIQPRGPYLLGGWSLGGTVAFECAAQLEKIGERPLFVALMDAPGPDLLTGHRQPLFSMETEREALLHFMPDGGGPALLEGASTPDEAWNRVAAYIEQHYSSEDILQWLPEEIRLLVPGFQELPALRALSLINRARALITARTRYVPTFKVETPIFYIGSVISGKSYETAWHSYCKQKVLASYTDGDHYSMLKTPYLEQTAGLFADMLSGAMSNSGYNLK